MKKKAPKGPELETSPYKSVAQEVDELCQSFRLICQRYAERVEGTLQQIHAKLVAEAAAQPPAARRSPDPEGTGKIHDARDMLTLLRTLKLKPELGRRKDLKKIETLVEDLQMLIEHWT